ncbi:MAG: PIN domain-containing protein [Rhodobacteraceae bacterium]|nr:PIN domain-containing protein [Paracoccaceae bacterium]
MRLLIDACVLYPTVPREILFGLAAQGRAELFWSPRILEEWRRAVLRNAPDDGDLVAAEIAVARARFPGAEVAPDSDVEADLRLPDANDAHVLAAALAAGADSVVTFNLKDFPGRVLARHGVMVRHPDALLLEAFHTAPDLIRAVTGPILAPLLAQGGTDARRLLKRARLPRLGKALSA